MVVIPARNEGPRLGSVLAELRQIQPGMPVLVVENGSEDDTEAVAVAGGARLVRSSPGYARALQAGFRVALDSGASQVVQMDADGQHPASAIDGLLRALEEADLVVGSRFVGGSGYRVPFWRKTAVLALGHWASAWARQPLRDVTSGFRAWRREALEALVPEYPERVADANLLVRAVRMGLRVKEVPVPMRERRSGRSMHEGPDAAIFALRMGILTAKEGLQPYGRTNIK